MEDGSPRLEDGAPHGIPAPLGEPKGDVEMKNNGPSEQLSEPEGDVEDTLARQYNFETEDIFENMSEMRAFVCRQAEVNGHSIGLYSRPFRYPNLKDVYGHNYETGFFYCTACAAGRNRSSAHGPFRVHFKWDKNASAPLAPCGSQRPNEPSQPIVRGAFVLSKSQFSCTTTNNMTRRQMIQKEAI